MSAMSAMSASLVKKPFLRLYLIVFLLAALTLVPVKFVNATSLTDQPTLVVSGYASLSSAPDKASISMAVINIEKTVQEAQKKNNTATNALISALKAEGIANEDIITDRYNLWPQYDYSELGKNNPPAIKGYEIHNELSVTVKDLSRLGIILDTAIQAGANNINSIQFDKADKKSLENNALTQAVHNAHDKALSIATALDMKLGSIIMVNESGFKTILPMNNMRISNIEADALGSTPINAGPINVQANITITYQLIK
jgi:uncharacterized protein YggE